MSPSQPILDSPFRLAQRGRPDWEPENYSGRFEGRMSMRDALVRSQNVPAVRLAAAVGPDRIRELAVRAGVRGEVPPTPVAALGVTALSPLEMATAYATFAAQGRRPAPRFVLRVEDESGEVLLETEPRAVAAVDPATSYILTDMLRDVVDRGTGAAVRRVGYYGPAAGKTGTTTDATDVWFAGYTPELVGVVWVGFDEVAPLPRRATGGGVAAPVWGRVMRRIYDDRATPDWPRRPSGVESVWVDPETGMALDDDCYPRYDEPRLELFLAGQEPMEVCPRRRRTRFGDRVGSWFDRMFGRDPAPRIPGEHDPDLGFPRLPTRGSAVARQPEGRPLPDEDRDRDRDWRRGDGPEGRPWAEERRRGRGDGR